MISRRRARTRRFMEVAPHALGPPPPRVLHDNRTVVVLAHDGRGTLVRALQAGADFFVQAPNPPHLVPGQVATLVLERRSCRRGRASVAGELRALRVDVAALGLPKLRLHERGELAVDATREEPRRAYEMDQVLPGAPEGEDPIFASIARRERGDLTGAVAALVGLLRRDLRCIDAHAHLGNMAFQVCAAHARAHYEVGVAFGDHALGPDFCGVLPWSYLDNRPFLRCLHGLGLSLWRLGRMVEAARVFERLVWLNPADDQGARQCLQDVRSERAWED